MRVKTEQKISEKFTHYKGYITTRELLGEGITNRQIAILLDKKMLEKVSHGHYWILSPQHVKPQDYKPVEAGMTNPAAVICADSACYYLGLIDVQPKHLSVATRRTDRRKMELNYPVIRHYYSERWYEEDILKRETEFGDYLIYDVDRSVCDCIIYRDTMEKKVFEAVIDNYQKKKDKDMDRLMEYAVQMRAANRVRKYLK